MSFLTLLLRCLCVCLSNPSGIFFYPSFLLTGSKSWFIRQSLQPKLVKSCLFRLAFPQSSSSCENPWAEFIETFQSPPICRVTSSVDRVYQFYWGRVTKASQEAPPQHILCPHLWRFFNRKLRTIVSIMREADVKGSVTCRCIKLHIPLSICIYN